MAKPNMGAGASRSSDAVNLSDIAPLLAGSLSSLPMSSAIIAGSTVLPQAAAGSPAVMGSVLTQVSLGAGHSFAADGITVPAGRYVVITTLAFNATNTAIREAGCYDGIRFRVNGGGSLGIPHTVTTLVDLPNGGKIQPAHVVDSATASIRTLAPGNNSTFEVYQVTSAASMSTVRSAAYCFEMCQTTFSYAAGAGFQQKRPFKPTIKPSRFRFHIRNRVQLADAYVGSSVGDINNLVVMIGKPAVDATTGEFNGNWLAAPTPVQSSVNMLAGGTTITPWIDASTYSLDPDQVHFLGLAFNAANVSGAQVALSGGTSYQNQSPADIATVAPSTALLKADNSANLQVIMEFEHSDKNAVQMLVVGNSLSGPSANGSATPFPITNVGEMGTFHQQWAQKERCIASNIAVAGAYSSHFLAGNARWDQFDGFNIPYVPDNILYMAAASSDIADTTSSATSNDVKNNVRNLIRRGRSKYPGAKRHDLTNIPPRSNFSGSNSTNTTNEYWRYDLNNWMHNQLPMQVSSCIDVDTLLTDWANPARLRPVFTTEGVHWTVRAHTEVAMAIPYGRAS